jgi:enamine deaminase RidA (YjgF/YER057c/UK114 family)
VNVSKVIYGKVPNGAGGQRLPFSQSFKNIESVLALAGCSLKDVIKVTVWLDDTRDFWTFNRIYQEYFPENPPVRSCVRAQMMVDCKVEIEVTAYKPH